LFRLCLGVAHVSDLVKEENLSDGPAGRAGAESAGVAIAPTRHIGVSGARLEHSADTPSGDERPVPITDTSSGNSDRCHTAREVTAHRAPPASKPALSIIR
jgi:hypothetical protein